MTWNTFIKKRLAAIVSTGRVVKDRLVEKVSGFSGNDLKEKFLKTCVTFLDEYMATTVFCEGIGPPPVTPTKKTHWATDASSASLTDLALLQPHSNYEMILLHYQLVLASHFVYAFGIRKNSMKPMNLFDTKVRSFKIYILCLMLFLLLYVCMIKVFISNYRRFTRRE